ncbi:MAG: hypothetical protein M3Z24_04155, partial [Chloroflexota bacterium]|nr:hypothetical protein [Chloroflexota bacterium]
MYIPLSLRLALFYTLVLGVALWFFGQTVYAQAEQRAYHDLDTTLSNRATSVQLGKTLLCSSDTPPQTFQLQATANVGNDGVAIEILDSQMHLLATTDGTNADFRQPGVTGLGFSPIPWDAQAAKHIATSEKGTGIYST